MSTVTVDAATLRTVLLALMGPSHLVAELQATRSLHSLTGDNPIELLAEQFNASVNAAQHPTSAPDSSLEQDAARYRALKEIGQTNIPVSRAWLTIRIVNPIPRSKNADDMDAIVDAAIAAKGQK